MRYHETPLQVRFHEVDSYHVVWHGHYISWFEVGRNDLTERFGIGPRHLKESQLLAPVVDLSCQFKIPVCFGDGIVVQTVLERTEVAKLIFQYRVVHQTHGKVLATGSTTHVLTDLSGILLYRVPSHIAEKIESMRTYLEI